MENCFTLLVNFNNPWVTNKRIELPHTKGITVHRALEKAYDQAHPSDINFVFDLRWSGDKLGYFIQTLCNVSTTLCSSWEIFYEGEPAAEGIDHEIAGPGVMVEFRYVLDRDIADSSHAKAKRASYGLVSTSQEPWASG